MSPSGAADDPRRPSAGQDLPRRQANRQRGQERPQRPRQSAALLAAEAVALAAQLRRAVEDGATLDEEATRDVRKARAALKMVVESQEPPCR